VEKDIINIADINLTLLKKLPLKPEAPYAFMIEKKSILNLNNDQLKKKPNKSNESSVVIFNA